VHNLIQDYRDVLEQHSTARSLPGALARKLRSYHRFITSQGHHLDSRPELVFPLAVAQPQDGCNRATAKGFPGNRVVFCPQGASVPLLMRPVA
jgi:hypothetical protein